LAVSDRHKAGLPNRGGASGEYQRPLSLWERAGVRVIKGCPKATLQSGEEAVGLLVAHLGFGMHLVHAAPAQGVVGLVKEYRLPSLVK
jgi:hypothetical protein